MNFGKTFILLLLPCCSLHSTTMADNNKRLKGGSDGNDAPSKRIKGEEGTGPFVARYCPVPVDADAEPIVKASDTFTDDDSGDGTTIPKDKELYEDQLKIFDIGDYSLRDFVRFNWTHGCRVENAINGLNEVIAIPVSKFQGDVGNLWDWYCSLREHHEPPYFHYKVVLDNLDGRIEGTKVFTCIEMMHEYLVRKVERHHSLKFTDDQKLIYDKQAIVAPDLGMKYGNLEAKLKVSKSVGKTTVTVPLCAFHTLSYVEAFNDMIRKENVDKLEFALHYGDYALGDLQGTTSEIFGSLSDFVAFLKPTVVAMKQKLFEHNSAIARMKLDD